MPGLRKFVSNIKARVGKDDEVEDRSASVVASGAKNSKLQKNALRPRDGLDFVYNNIPIVQALRRSSYDAAESVDDFEAEIWASTSRPQNAYTSGQRPRTAQHNGLVSKYGLTINTAAANLEANRSVPPRYSIVKPADDDHIDDMSSNQLRWLNSRTNTDMSGDQRKSGSSSSSRPSASKNSSTEHLPGVWKSFVEPLTPDTAQSSFVEQDMPEAGLSKAQGKKRLLAISDIDWSQLDDDEGVEIAKAYGALSFAGRVPRSKSSADHGAPRIPGQSSIKDRWRNGEDFSNEYEDFWLSEEAERKDQELKERLRQLEAERIAKEEERQRREAEEVARLLAEEEAAAEAARIAEERARLRECVVCGDAKNPLEYAAHAPTAKCQHPPQTCKECIESWMASEFDTKGCDNIKCPECDEVLEYNEVKESASSETFEKFDNMAARNALGSLEEFAWCLKPGCGSGQMNIDNNSFMDCTSCGYKQCLEHKVAWHVGETCERYEYRVSGQQQRDEEKKTELMLDLVSKKCPNKTCGWRIQKVDGCEHMTCKKCKHEFCWLCLASHADIKRDGNTAHAPNCKFHSKNLEVSWPFNAH